MRCSIVAFTALVAATAQSMAQAADKSVLPLDIPGSVGIAVPLEIGEWVEWRCLAETGPRHHWLIGYNEQHVPKLANEKCPQDRVKMGPYEISNVITLKAASQVRGEGPGTWDDMDTSFRTQHEWKLNAYFTGDRNDNATFEISRKR